MATTGVKRAGIVHVRRRHAGGQQPTVDVDEYVALQTDEFLASVVSLCPSCLARFDRLAVDDRRARRGFPPLPFAVEHHEEMVDPLEQTGVPPGVEVTLDGAVGWEGDGQSPPLTAGAQKVKDRFEQQAQRPFSGSPGRHRDREERTDQSPRLISYEGLTPRRNGCSFPSNGGVGHQEAPGKESPV